MNSVYEILSNEIIFNGFLLGLVTTFFIIDSYRAWDPSRPRMMRLNYRKCAGLYLCIMVALIYYGEF